MKEKARQYYCTRCRKKITVCSKCYHGRIYCPPCAIAVRKEVQCKASQRYQQTSKGKANHVKRQKNYREKQKNKFSCVTHPSSHKTKNLTSSASVMQAIDMKQIEKPEQSDKDHCDFCNKEVSLAEVKTDFTQECIAKLIRGDILPRKPLNKNIGKISS